MMMKTEDSTDSGSFYKVEGFDPLADQWKFPRQLSGYAVVASGKE